MAFVAVVTGGCGFIGSHLVDLLLAQGFEVRVIDNLTGGRRSNLGHHSADVPLKIFEQDIRDISKESPIFDGCDFVFHLAGIGDIVPSIEYPSDYMDVNVNGTVKVLEAARHAQVKKFVYASSSSCYGLADVPTSENHPLSPQYPYALSKLMGEQAAFHWEKVYGMPVNAICIFNAYGTRVKTTGAYGAVFGVFFKQLLAGVPLTVVGDGEQSRDFIYVTDVANAFYQAANTVVSGERFNVGAGKPQTINHLVELIGGDVQYIPKRPGEPDCTFADIKKITTTLDWSPRVSFQEGILKMQTDMSAWNDAPLWDKDSIDVATKTWFKYLS